MTTRARLLLRAAMVLSLAATAVVVGGDTLRPRAARAADLATVASRSSRAFVSSSVKLTVSDCCWVQFFPACSYWWRTVSAGQMRSDDVGI